MAMTKRRTVGLYLVHVPSPAEREAHGADPGGGWPKGRGTKTWVLRWQGSDGKRHSESIGTPPRVTKTMAKKVQARRQGELDEGERPVHEFGTWALEDLVRQDRELADLRPRSMTRTVKASEYLVAALGASTNVHELGREEAARFKRYLARTVRTPAGERLKAATVVRLYGAAQGILSRMVDLGRLKANALDQRGRRRQKRPDEAVPEVVNFGVDEVRALAEAAPSAWWHDLVWVALGCGLRQEELLTLAWADVRIGKGSATVAVKVKDAPFRWQPKTAASLRIVVVCLPEAVAALGRLKVRADGPMVFLRPRDVERLVAHVAGNGGDLPPKLLNNMGRQWRTMVVKAKAAKPETVRGWEAWRFADLRHSFGTAMAPHVSVKELQRMMGHASLQTTLRYYLGIGADLEERMAKAWTAAA